ncbi:diguanylate cyclase with GAF sensor [Gloeothece citriformis PCC 7424]|uniref:Diguanylate cyclase with GAF sensor n=1 Tax=Gloeothece citriformis (strain PCC 7424) TaxID=65393 RepID=B7KFV2_GLOC7|nr:sensor domain-containing diguanylate cyclase [Gloeothece citriformis]ACK69145.1 diguanylate cyclase with GAF sensor [Gloeothece citriformis PCC 7424]
MLHPQTTLLINVIQKLSLARELETIISLVKDTARDLTEADGASFILQDNDHCFYVDENAIAPLWKGKRFPMSICIGGWVMLNRQPVIITNVFGDNRIPFEAYEPTFVKSLAVVPIRTQAPVGAIGVYWSRHHCATAEQIQTLQALADSTSIAMENVQIYSQLEQRVQERTLALESANQSLKQEITERKRAEEEVRRLSVTDELTGLYNRRGFLFLAEQQWKLAHRHKTLYVLVFLDLDGLKKVNDTYGHEIGDRMISDLATLLKNNLRESDIIGRVGGDEFVIFALKKFGDSQELTKRLQLAINQFNLQEKRVYQLSASIGIVDCHPCENCSLEKYMANADAAMYMQKRAKKQARV